MMAHVPICLKCPHAVYRLYGPADLILYIGRSKNPRKRFYVHKCKSKHTWWPYVQRHEIDWYPNLHEALLAETRELRLHRPLCNPVIPNENGKHATIGPGLVPARSTWDQVATIAAEHGESTIDVIEAALENYVRRHRGETA